MLQSLLIVRGLVGFGLAGAPQMYSMFSEFVPTKQRGTKLLLFQMFWSIGALLEAGIAWYSLPRFGWRGLVLLSSLPSSKCGGSFSRLTLHRLTCSCSDGLNSALSNSCHQCPQLHYLQDRCALFSICEFAKGTDPSFGSYA